MNTKQEEEQLRRDLEILRLEQKLERLRSLRMKEQDTQGQPDSLEIKGGNDDSIDSSSSSNSISISKRDNARSKKKLERYARRRRASACIIGMVLLGLVAFGVIHLINWLAGESISFRAGGGGSGSTTAISILEVAIHDTPDDCWSVFHGRVYDLTTYRHPAGNFYIHAVCGIDGTSSYRTEHSERLLRTITQHQVGLLGDETTDQEFMGSNQDEATPVPTSPPATETPTTAQYLQDVINGDATARPTPEPTPSPSPRPTPTPTACTGCISQTELSRHDSSSDCWMVFGEDVYDLTSYARSHPGGSREIYPHCGTDATRAYERERSHKLSDLNVVRSLKVGVYTGEL